jgi:predicted nucleotidyltransferase
LNDAGAEFLVVGAYAVIHYTEPRYTKDLDLWVRPSPDNAARVYQALAAFGAPLDTLSVDDLTNPTMVFQMGIEPVRVDILMGLPGLDFDESMAHALTSTFGGIPVHIMGLDQLIVAKRAAGRPQDLIDLDRLERAREAEGHDS